MPSLRIKQRRIKQRPDTHVDAKQALRTHVEQLPIEQQREFVSVALELINARNSILPAHSKSQRDREQNLQRWRELVR